MTDPAAASEGAVPADPPTVMGIPGPGLYTRVEQLYLKPGELLTVWLCRDNNGCDVVQVELRVNAKGEPELFSNLPAKSFDEWRVMGTTP